MHGYTLYESSRMEQSRRVVRERTRRHLDEGVATAFHGELEPVGRGATCGHVGRLTMSLAWQGAQAAADVPRGRQEHHPIRRAGGMLSRMVGHDRLMTINNECDAHHGIPPRASNGSQRVDHLAPPDRWNWIDWVSGSRVSRSKDQRQPSCHRPALVTPGYFLVFLVTPLGDDARASFHPAGLTRELM